MNTVSTIERAALPAHPAAAIFPMMSDSELLELAEDIKKNGLLEPITLHEGQILDGRNRLAACDIAGVEPSFQEWNGLGELPTRYVIAKNLQRRQLTIGQRAAIAAECVPMLHEEARQRQVAAGMANFGHQSSSIGQDSEKGSARSIAARQVGVSESSLQRAIEVKESDPEAFEKVKKGEITVNAAHQKVRVATGQCSVDGCGKVARTRGLCVGHYGRVVVHGSVGNKPLRGPQSERLEQIKTMAAQGYNSAQIGEAMGVRGQHVRDLARANGIALAELESKSRPRIDPVRMVRETVNGAVNLTAGLEMIDGLTIKADEADIKSWAEALGESIRVLTKLHRQLKRAYGN